MMITGIKVVCINDTFDDWVLRIYNELPIKDNIYTIRTSSFGRTDPKDVGIDSMANCVTLEEIHNPLDKSYTAGKRELQFRADRFKELEEQAIENAQETYAYNS